MIAFQPTDRGYFADNATCLAGLSGNTGFMTKLLLNSFTDIAIGFVVDSSLATIKNSNLQELFSDVATGKVAVGDAASQ